MFMIAFTTRFRCLGGLYCVTGGVPPNIARMKKSNVIRSSLSLFAFFDDGVDLLLVKTIGAAAEVLQDELQRLSRQASSPGVPRSEGPHGVFFDQSPKRLQLRHHLHEIVERYPVYVSDARKV
mmetsp:Transcript_19718/g.54193  ORF Transcript_19718/g.54193 Transcript_19718/m.54193 type:complete len:123 (+) Transcript_19718:261-629(+)